tara:strand:+ start:179 stop:589 length:411 start_codon:yes stop_codon:yes gene_type:complete
MAKKFPDLTGDGKVTQKDILKGRGVKGMNEGGEVDKKGKKKKDAAKEYYAKAMLGATPLVGAGVGAMKKKKKKGMAAGGMAKKKKGYAMGGPMKKKGYAMGGPMKKKGYKKGGKVRGAGIVMKGVRPAKMVKMKGS